MKKPLHCTLKHVPRLILCLQAYDTTTCYRKGEELYTVNVLSKAYLKEHGIKESDDILLVHAEFDFLESVCSVNVHEEKLKEVRMKTEHSRTLLYPSEVDD